MMLTGNADQQTAVDAINEGHIFRFLTKPCSSEQMTKVLEAGLAQYRLVTAEKEVLEKTLIGSVSILIEVLSMTHPMEFGRVKKLLDYVREVARAVNYHNAWELEIAALLSPIGHLTIPPDIMLKVQGNCVLTDLEKEIIARVPETSYELLIKIPRLGNVAQIIRYSTKLFNGAGIPKDAVSGEKIPLGSRILKILCDLMDVEAQNIPRSVALRLLSNRSGWYDDQLLNVIIAHYMPPLSVVTPGARVAPERTLRMLKPETLQALAEASTGEPYSVAISFEELLIGDVLVSDIRTSDGQLLLSEGNEITEAALERLKYYAQIKGIQEPIHVAVDSEPSESNE
jgi:hypothetical protein